MQLDRNEVVPGRADGRGTDAVYQLWFEQFKQVSWLGATAAGGALFLLQILSGIELTSRYGIAVALCALAAAVSVLGQIRLVEAATDGQPVGRELRGFLYAALVLLSAGVGLLVGMLT
ncbi:MAG TPA: hypothetical protein VF192_02120 [Longimicrobiales bacterium]